jgi:hypothetical protein
VLKFELQLLLDRLRRRRQKTVQAEAAALFGREGEPLFVAGFFSSQIPRLFVRIASGPRTPGSSASLLVRPEYRREERGWNADGLHGVLGPVHSRNSKRTSK